MRTSLIVILCVGLAGLLFSGYLSYQEMFGTCEVGCSAESGPAVLGLPVCIYGFFMYLAVVMVAALGLQSK